MKYLSFLFLLLTTACICSAQDYPFAWGGDVRVKWHHNHKMEYINYESNINAMFIHENAWVDSKIKITLDDWFNEVNYAKINLERALIGYKLDFADGAQIFAEVGHAKLDHLFDSKLQYNSYLNGFHVGYSLKNLLIHAAFNHVTSFSDYYSFHVEGSYQLDKIPLTVSYNFTHWIPEHAFSISQVTAKWALDSLMHKSMNIYGAVLTNHQHNSHTNAYYLGFNIGTIEKTQDYMFDVHYQYTCVNAIPEFDYAGFGEGIELKAMYAVTDHLTLQGKMIFSTKNKTEFSAIYDW